MNPLTDPNANSGAGYPASPGYGAEPNSAGIPIVFPSPGSSGTPVILPSVQPGTGNPNPGNVNQPESPMTAYRETFFKNYGTNPFIEADIDPLSTFALDVDTGAYTYGRGQLISNRLPHKDSVRTEEYLNAFSYAYPQPASGAMAIHTELGPAFFGEDDARLLRVGLQAKEVLDRARKDASLTFVIDVSGSMNRENRLELVKQSLTRLVSELRPSDRIGIVIYGTEARTLLEHTPVSNKTAILAALTSLKPEGSTNVEAGLSLGYSKASAAFLNGGINRVILCSDGVANVGETGPDKMLATIKKQSESGITLTTLGFGLGDFNDTLMEQLANQGDGNYAYIDTLDEAKRVLGRDLTSTLQTIAKDAKIQVAFNKEIVAQYRLLGYENRDVADKDFRNDAIDAGEVGSNHSVTALYELRFKPGVTAGDVAQVYLRYKDVANLNRIQEVSRLVNLNELSSFRDATVSFKLATAVAEFSEILRESVFAREGKLDEVYRLAQTVQEQAPQDAKIKEFVTLVAKANQLQRPLSTQSQTEILTRSTNPRALPDWQAYLLRQLGGKALQ